MAAVSIGVWALLIWSLCLTNLKTSCVFESVWHTADKSSLLRGSTNVNLDITTRHLVDATEDDRSVGNLLRAFNNQEVSDSTVWYLRLVTSAFLRTRADFYQPFIEGATCMEDFCAQNVEPMTSVCDHIQITAVTQALDIPLLVEYVDSLDYGTNQHVFPDGSSPCVYMLYKQNHYTVLYKPGVTTKWK